MNYIKIDTEDVCNGDGLRVVLWLSGCTHHCYNCQNPQTWDVNSGIPFDESAKEELFRELNKDYISGLTLSGGDPLYEANLDGMLNLVEEIRLSWGNAKTIWLYTGYTFDFLKKKYIENMYVEYGCASFSIEAYQWVKRWKIISECNILVDGKYIDSQRDVTLRWRGSANQRVIDIKKSLQQGQVITVC